MKGINIIIAFILLSSVFISCKKESTTQEPSVVVRLMLSNRIPEPEGAFGLKVDGEIVPPDFSTGKILNKLLEQGNHTITFFNLQNNKVLLDTTFSVDRQRQNSYMFFRADSNDKVSLLEPINTDTVAAPPEGYIKVNFANFTNHIPGNIKLDFVVTQFNELGEMDTVAIWDDPGKNFSTYKLLKMGQIGGEYNLDFAVFLRNSVTKEDIYMITDPVTGLPIDYTGFFYIGLAGLYPQQKIFTYYIYTDRNPSDPSIVSTSQGNL